MNYESAFEQRDLTRIDKLNALTNPDTFWDDVRKMVGRTMSDHALHRWQILAEKRYREIIGEE